MMKCLTIVIVLCLFGLFSDHALAQQGSEWTEVSPSGESFRISVPTKTVTTTNGEGGLGGKLYESSSEGSMYLVWSFESQSTQSLPEVGEYLDATADLVWGHLLLPAREKLPEDLRRIASMTYVKEISGKSLPGREYSLAIGDLSGTTQFYIAYRRAFVLVVLDSPSSPWHRMRFFDSFLVSPELAKLRPVVAESSPSKPTQADTDRVFSGREVTKKARVLSKPEPTYTESARQYSIQGTVVLRAVFSKDGEVTNLHVVSGLPHGLTRRAIAAARGMKFTPAEVDGHPVSMWMELHYNFNLY